MFEKELGKEDQNQQESKNGNSYRHNVKVYQEDIKSKDEFKRNETSFNLNTQTFLTSRQVSKIQDTEQLGQSFSKKKLVKKGKILGNQQKIDN